MQTPKSLLPIQKERQNHFTNRRLSNDSTNKLQCHNLCILCLAFWITASNSFKSMTYMACFNYSCNPTSTNTLGVSGQHRNTPNFSEHKLHYRYIPVHTIYLCLHSKQPKCISSQPKTHWGSMSTLCLRYLLSAKPLLHTVQAWRVPPRCAHSPKNSLNVATWNNDHYWQSFETSSLRASNPLQVTSSWEPDCLSYNFEWGRIRSYSWPKSMYLDVSSQDLAEMNAERCRELTAEGIQTNENKSIYSKTQYHILWCSMTLWRQSVRFESQNFKNCGTTFYMHSIDENLSLKWCAQVVDL